MRLNVPFHMRIQTMNETGIAHHGKPIPVRIWSDNPMPPSSATRTRKETRTIPMSTTKKNGNPNLSLVASTIVCLLTAARRPDISTRKIRQIVPSRIAQRS
jgi:hypothetical protein